MYVLYFALRCCAFVWPVLLGCWPAVSLATSVAASEPRQVSAGRNLFTRDWKINDPASGGGDGLGPMYNATSCVACHNQGGTGGGGSLDHNADLLTIIAINNKGIKQLNAVMPVRVQQRLNQLAPDFRLSSTILVHRYGSEPEYTTGLRSQLLGLSVPLALDFGSSDASRTHVVEAPARGTYPAAGDLVGARLFDQPGDNAGIKSVTFQTSQRNTPALFGAGLIDKIDARELTIVQARQQLKMQGRLSGRFGWRGQTATLKEFVVGACANELGLQTPGHLQPRDPLEPSYISRDADMDEQQVDEMVRYVASLPPPSEMPPVNAVQAHELQRGEVMFKVARCNVCHVRDIGEVKGIYSDLLMHDMGSSLVAQLGVPTFPLPDPYATSSAPDPPPSVRGPTAGYNGGDSQQWRTPPLWGVRYSAPYLHDGRAATVEVAIRMHGGQARISAQRFQLMKPEDQQGLVAFVLSLGAPRETGAQSVQPDNKPPDRFTSNSK